ncbi:MAG: hypothetical protein NC541_04860 [bacterium]|nr:hypothetical protein [bacterium]
MKNFGTLFCYEMKKLLKRKLNWVTILALTGFCVLGIVQSGAVYPGFLVSLFDESGNETESRIISGEEIYATWRETAGSLDGRVMDDAFFQELRENLSDLEDSNLSMHFWTEDATYHGAYNIIKGLFAEPLDVTAEEFYDAQWEQTHYTCETFGRTEQSGGILSPAEIDYWMEQAAKIERPFVYRDAWRGVTALMDYFPVPLGLLPVVGAICVCAVFSEDRRTRVDALVFTSRKCRVPLYLAKILAGAVMAALAGLVIVTGITAAFLAVWGTHGLNALYQMYDIASPRPVTIWQILLPMLALLVLYTLFCGCISMLVSALTRSSLAALAVPVLLAQALDRWHSPSYGWAGYLPDNLIGWNGILNLEPVNFFGAHLTNLRFGPLLYLALTALLLALCWPGWRRSAVGKG